MEGLRIKCNLVAEVEYPKSSTEILSQRHQFASGTDGASHSTLSPPLNKKTKTKAQPFNSRILRIYES